MKTESLRMCIACRKMFPKSQLTRVVKNNINEIFIDVTKKANGRGAWICKNEECLKKCVKTRGFNRSFKTDIKQSVYENLKVEEK